MMRRKHLPTVILLLLLTVLPVANQPVVASADLKKADTSSLVLSSLWGPTIRQWDSHVAVLSRQSGIDPDFIAAVIHEESNGDHNAVSRMGAVGLMGVMPASPGLEWRPAPDELKKPATNLRWGVAILSEILRQSGGDPYAALAAYSGGWDLVDNRVPQQYAAGVLDQYARAVVVRNGLSPDIASHWTIGVRMRRGNVPNQSLLVLGEQPVSGLHTYGRHTMFNDVDGAGRAYYIEGYAVPVALVVPMAAESFGSSHKLEAPLRARLGETEAKVTGSNPRILLACLPSLSRLRGRASTRWFAPSQCPSWHR